MFFLVLSCSLYTHPSHAIGRATSFDFSTMPNHLRKHSGPTRATRSVRCFQSTSKRNPEKGVGVGIGNSIWVGVQSCHHDHSGHVPREQGQRGPGWQGWQGWQGWRVRPSKNGKQHGRLCVARQTIVGHVVAASNRWG